MRLSIQDLPALAARGYAVPAFDVQAMRARTRENPTWVHFGAGNLFRAFPAASLQALLDAGLYDRGVIAAETYDDTLIDRAFRPVDDLSVLVTLRADGTAEKRVIASVAESLSAFPNTPDFARLTAVFENPSLQMASFTITEKGYAVRADDPDAPRTAMGVVCRLLRARLRAGGAPLALVSMDNCSRNGDKLRDSLAAIAAGWGDAALSSYLADGARVSFPVTMIDKITPRPDARVRDMLVADGLSELPLIETPKHSYTSYFVNAEEAQTLVVTDDFPAGRPPLDKAGIHFTTRDTVERAERMKVCTCLNPLHTALAVLGCLTRMPTISACMRDDALRGFVTKLGVQECLPVAEDPGILRPRAFLQEVLEKRLPNPFLPDTPQRIATDTSQKLSIRFGWTIAQYGDRARELRLIPFVLAAWLRYLTGVGDDGAPMAISPDPQLASLAPVIAAAVERTPDGARLHADALRPLLSDDAIFGVNLYEAGLAELVLSDLEALLAGDGAVRAGIARLAGTPA